MDELIIEERKVKEEIAKIVNNSRLPAFILKNIFNEFETIANTISQQEYAQAVAKVSSKNKEATNKNEKN